MLKNTLAKLYNSSQSSKLIRVFSLIFGLSVVALSAFRLRELYLLQLSRKSLPNEPLLSGTLEFLYYTPSAFLLLAGLSLIVSWRQSLFTIVSLVQLPFALVFGFVWISESLLREFSFSWHLTNPAVSSLPIASPIEVISIMGLSIALLMSSLQLIVTAFQGALRVIAGWFATAAAVFGVVGLYGLALNVTAGSGWSDFYALSGFESGCFVLLGTFFAFLNWNEKQTEEMNPMWPSSVVFLCLAGVSLAAYQSTLELTYKTLYGLTEETSAKFERLVRDSFQSYAKMTSRMAERFDLDVQEDFNATVADVRSFVRDLPTVKAIGKADSEGELILFESEFKTSFRNLSDFPQVQETWADNVEKWRLGSSHKADSTISSHAFNYLNTDSKALALVHPVYNSGSFIGALVVFIEIEKILNRFSGETPRLSDYSLRIFQGTEVLFSRSDERNFVGDSGIVFTKPIRILGNSLNLEVTPAKSLTKAFAFERSERILSYGILLSLFFAIILHFAILVRNQSRRAKKLSRELQGILDGSTRVSIIVTDLKGNITRFNPGAERLLGYKASEVVGRMTALDFHEPIELEEHRQQLAMKHLEYETMEAFDALTFEAKTGSFKEKNWSYLQKNGKRVPVSLFITTIHDTEPGAISELEQSTAQRKQNSAPVGFLEIAIDATSSEKKLLNYAKKLESKNKELEEFTYVASHDLKEPLRNLISYSSLLESDLEGDLPPDAAEDIHYIKDAARRMKALIDDLLFLSKAGSSAIAPQEFPLSKLIDEVEINLELRIKETDSRVVREFEDATITADFVLFNQLFTNLISNAIKFVKTGVKPVVKVGLEVRSESVLLVVSDNGIGMKKDHLKQIFLPFKRLHGMSAYEGTGVGLSICRKIVERHDGNLWVDSEVGQGSRFFIELPVKKGTD